MSRKKKPYTFEWLRYTLGLIHKNKSLLLFTGISSATCMLLLAVIGRYVWNAELSLLLKGEIHYTQLSMAYIALFLFFFLCHIISGFTLLISLHYSRGLSKGVSSSFLASFKLGFSYLIRIFKWALFNTTLGLIIKSFYFYFKQFRLFKNLMKEQDWTIASYFVYPVMLDNDASTLDLLRGSADLISHRWGPKQCINFNITFLVLPARLLSLFPLIVGMALGSVQLRIIGAVLTVILWVTVSAYVGAIDVLIRSLLYCSITSENKNIMVTKEMVDNFFVEIKEE